MDGGPSIHANGSGSNDVLGVGASVGNGGRQCGSVTTFLSRRTICVRVQAYIQSVGETRSRSEVEGSRLFGRIGNIPLDFRVF